MIYLNKEKVHDKIRACWIGKNIGGTLGTPYEGNREMHDISGFATKPGEVLANDDLDLQIIWLMAMDERGPEVVNAAVLGEYWLAYVDPYWNEYGVGKTNMKDGFYPPLSGELSNEDWKHSNGAWIRTEVWACLYPGRPDKAVERAFMDASVDHGYGEGTYAAMFIAAMESAAFLFSDAEVLLKIGLSKIPEDCRVARSVRIVMEEYKKGTQWRIVRQMLVEDSADLGWFQAPANVAFVVLGLLYGEGDFKNSLILAVDCGDDTDCTAATLGSLLGIIGGTVAIPCDWQEYVGDSIETMSLMQGNNSYPKTCTELTDIIMKLLPATNRVQYPWSRFAGYYIRPFDFAVIHDAPEDFSQVKVEDFINREFAEKMFGRSRYSFRKEGLLADVWIEYEAEPRISKNGKLSGKLTIQQKRWPELWAEIPGQRRYYLRWLLPESWTIDSPLNVFVTYGDEHGQSKDLQTVNFMITAGERVEAFNRVVLEISAVGHLEPMYVPLSIIC